MATTLRSLPMTTPPREHPDRPTDPTSTFALEAGGWLDYPPHFKGWRPGQEEAIEEIVAAYNAGYRTVLVDAPTGAGKTWIAVGVRAALNQVATYSCHSLALQYQWADDFKPYPMLMGRSNYEISFPGVPPDITAADCTWEAANPEKGCMWCPERASCPYEVSKRRALAASFRCVNHSYLVTEARHVQRFKHPLLILDEAELVEDAILKQVEVTFTSRLRDELDLGKPRFVTKEESIREWLEETVVPALDVDYRSYPRDTSDRRIIKQRNTAESRLDQTRFVLKSYGEGWVFDHGHDTWALRPVWASHWGKLWLSEDPRGRGERSASGTLVDQSAFTSDGPPRRILAMSATLISGAQVAADLGLPEPFTTVTVSGGFDPALRPVYIAPLADLRSKTEEGVGDEGQTVRRSKGVPDEEYDKLATALRAIMARHPNDRILVHTHSYKAARELYERVGSNPRVLMYQDGGRDRALDAYLDQEAAVLLASSLERGVNLPDDKCRVVVIAKVPFPYLGDPVVQKRRWTGGPAGSRWYACETIRAIVQGCGRAMRHSEDFCEVYVLDAAFMSLWRKDRQLFPRWFAAALVMNFNSRALLAEGQRITRLLSRARELRASAGIPEPPLRPPIVGRWRSDADWGGRRKRGEGKGGKTGSHVSGNGSAAPSPSPSPDTPSLFDYLMEDEPDSPAKKPAADG